jgi:hypothetical protein
MTDVRQKAEEAGSKPSVFEQAKASVDRMFGKKPAPDGGDTPVPPPPTTGNMPAVLPPDLGPRQ